ncbi:hypothetical protein [Neobacillus cucumis]|uniref:hypothetical protein n=1 Tax=Neobacillus cucumis TaxID=1740721 RepID=UPI002852F99C|nr:hypothetical protein [Neobacillus cucumis]MDR4947646.1 hypothetical protein [Neobacillus cucumis]
MSQEKNLNNGSFAKFVLNHTDKNNNHEQNISNVNHEFATENDVQSIKNNLKNEEQQN